MRYTMESEPGGTWTVLDTETGEKVLEGESYQVASSVEHELNMGAPGTSETSEVADAIRQPRSALKRAMQIFAAHHYTTDMGQDLSEVASNVGKSVQDLESAASSKNWREARKAANSAIGGLNFFVALLNERDLY